MAGQHFQWQGQDLLLFCHVQPGASKSEFCGLHGDKLKIRIKAPPVDGKANAAIIDFISEIFFVSKSQVKIEQGHAGRSKTIRILSPKNFPKDFPIAPN